MRTLFSSVVCIELVAACGGSNERSGVDAPVQDMGPICDPTEAFDPPVPLAWISTGRS